MKSIKAIKKLFDQKPVQAAETDADRCNNAALPNFGKTLIHLGCGEYNDPRYINIDARKLPHVHYVGPIQDLSFLDDNYADLIYASHVLEHLGHDKIEPALREWRRVLKPGKVLRLSVPDFDKLIEVYKTEGCQIDAVKYPLMGLQDYDENQHKSIFNERFLSELLKKAGFAQIRSWDPETAEYHNFDDFSKKKIMGKYFISLNIEAIK